MGISKTGNHKGFSLIELLIALTLLAVGMMAVASMQTVAIGSNDIANKNSELAALAQQVMETSCREPAIILCSPLGSMALTISTVRR